MIAVGSGFNTKKSRSKESLKLLTYGLTNFDTIQIAKKNENFSEIDVWLGKSDKVQVYIKDDIFKTIPKAKKKYLKSVIEYVGPVEAPIKKNQSIAKLKIFYMDELLSEHELYALTEIKKVNIISRIFRSLNYLVWGDV